MFQLKSVGGPANPAGSVEFDDRGNARWVPNTDVRSEDAILQLLAVDWLQLLEDEAA
jgi:hypothetical protein